MESWINKIEKLRKEQRKEIKELVKSASIKRSTYYRWRIGKGEPTISDVVVLLDELGYELRILKQI